VKDQGPVKTFPPHGSDEALRVRVRSRCPDRRLDDLDVFGSEHLIKTAVNLESRSRIKNLVGRSRSDSTKVKFRASWVTQSPDRVSDLRADRQGGRSGR